MAWVVVAVLASSVPAQAYRPFFSTDAAVADPKEIELELGYFTLRREGGQNTFLVPSAVLNFGLWPNVELVAEFRIAEGAGSEVNVVDPGLFVKAVLREGVLQEREGVSVAIETGPLLPSTVRGDRGVGFETIGIASVPVAPLTIHVNLGGGLDRHAARPFAFWGIIGELPVRPELRVVTEITGESVQGVRANNSALVGVIWQPSRRVSWDAAVRHGISRGAPDWEFTTGVTFGFAAPNRLW